MRSNLHFLNDYLDISRDQGIQFLKEYDNGRKASFTYSAIIIVKYLMSLGITKEFSRIFDDLNKELNENFKRRNFQRPNQPKREFKWRK